MIRRFDEVDQSQADAEKKARKRMMIMGFSLLVLVGLIITALLVTSNEEKKSPGQMAETVASTSKVQTELNAICNLTLYPSSCIGSLQPLVNSSENVNLTTIFKFSLKVVIQELNAVSMKFDHLDVRNRTTYYNVKALNDCKELVLLALEKINQTVDTSVNFSSKSIVDDMKTWLSSTITYQETCIDGFQNGTVDLRTFMGYTLNNSTEMASNSLAVLSVAAKFLDGLHFTRRRKLLSFGHDGHVPYWAVPRFRRLLQFGNFENNDFNRFGGAGNFGYNWQKPWKFNYDPNLWKSYVGATNGAANSSSVTDNGGAANSSSVTDNGGAANSSSVTDNGGAAKSTGVTDDGSAKNGGAMNGGSVSENGSGSSGAEENGGETGAGEILGSEHLKPALIVALDGSGDHKTISAAVDAVPEKNTAVFIIYVKEGTYFENVNINSKKWNILMYGDGKDKTIVSGSLNAVDGTPTYSSATFSVKGKGFMVKDMGFFNTAGAVKHQAVALMSDSDMSVYYRCRFDAYQDTLYSHTGRQFYKDCDITGTVDFIFGNAAQVLQECNILPRKPLSGQKDAITAQGRTDPNQNTGITIQNSKISSSEDMSNVEVYLGRPWKDYAATAYITSYIPDFIRAEGWMAWSSGTVPPYTIVYGEYKNKGPGAAIGGRVKWKGVSSDMTPEAANRFGVKKLLNGDRWLPKSGVSHILGL